MAFFILSEHFRVKAVLTGILIAFRGTALPDGRGVRGRSGRGLAALLKTGLVRREMVSVHSCYRMGLAWNLISKVAQALRANKVTLSLPAHGLRRVSGAGD